MSTKESIHLETLGRIGMAEKHAEFSHDQLEPYMGIGSEDIEKQYHEVICDAVNGISVSTIIFTYRGSL